MKSMCHHSIPLALGVVLFSTAGLGLAQEILNVNTFDAPGETNAWTAANAGAVFYDTTNDAGGTTVSGSLRVTCNFQDTGGTWQDAQASTDLGAKAFSGSRYFKVAFDVKVDGANSMTRNGLDYGTLSLVIQSGTNYWNNAIPGVVLDTADEWKHVEFILLPPDDDVQRLTFYLGDSLFTAPIAYNIDNIKVTPLPDTFVLDSFDANSIDTTYPNPIVWEQESWAVPADLVYDTALDAAGGAGSLRVSFNFEAKPDDYQQSVIHYTMRTNRCDFTRFAYVEMDIKVDPVSTLSQDGSSFGSFEIIPECGEWVSIAASNLTTSYFNWTHIKAAIPSSLTNVSQIHFKLGRGWAGNGLLGAVVVNIDNLKLTAPPLPQPMTFLATAGTPGLSISTRANGGQWDRQNIVTPATNTIDTTQNYLYSWVNRAQPVSYSMTIAQFPDNAHTNFQAHMFLVKYSTITAGWNETYGAVDWNGETLATLVIKNDNNGVAHATLAYKANHPGTNDYTSVATVSSIKAVGTWKITFQNNTTGTISTPEGTSSNFTLPNDVANAFDGGMYVDFGVQANETANLGQSITLSRIQITGVETPIDDSFAGPLATSNFAWRSTVTDPGSDLLVTPSGTAFWYGWALPDHGYVFQTTTNVAGGWTTSTLPVIESATKKRVALPDKFPGSQAGFFRMYKQ